MLDSGSNDRTVEIAFQDHIDHAGDGIRAVGGGGAVGEDINAIQRECGDDRRIDGANAVRLRREADAVHHQQGPRPSLIEAANIDA